MPTKKRRCEHCREWFNLNSRGRRRRFCLPACRQAVEIMQPTKDPVGTR